MVIEQLAGGYGNLVTLERGMVRKQFKDNPFTHVPLRVRQRREELHLRYFAESGITPKLLSVEDDTLWIEFIEGENFLERFKKGECVLEEAGFLLRRIHQPVVRSFRYLQDSFERKLERASQRGAGLIDYLGLRLDIQPNWKVVEQRGTTRIHGDYWLANIIGGKVIDWEFGTIGSPYQDFAAMELWTFDELGGREEFWQGYGSGMDQETVNQYVALECVDYLGDIGVEQYREEEENGFYHQKAAFLARL